MKKGFPERSDWSTCFANIFKSSKDNKLRQFSFKVLHRIIPSKKELLKLTSADLCPLRLNQDSIEHTFIHCRESADFITKTLGWFNDYDKTRIQLSNRQISFNTFEDSSPSQLSNPLNRRLRLLNVLQKELLQKHYKETKFKGSFMQVVSTVLYCKLWQTLLNVCGY